MSKSTKPFPKESDLCAAFITAVGDVWTAYPETGGWDILLVRNADGFQVGIQAKLRLNAEVFAQALEAARIVERDGPDCRAVLVPWTDCQLGLGSFAPYIGVTIIRMTGPNKVLRRGGAWRQFEPDLPDANDWYAERHWFELAPARRHKLPEYVPDVVAGAASPLQLTEWKIKALKIAVLIEQRGHVTRKDFGHLNLDHADGSPPNRGGSSSTPAASSPATASPISGPSTRSSTSRSRMTSRNGRRRRWS